MFATWQVILQCIHLTIHTMIFIKFINKNSHSMKKNKKISITVAKVRFNNMYG